MTLTPLVAIGHSNVVPTATITGGAWSNSRDLVKTRPTGLRAVAADNNLASTRLTLTWPRPQPMRMLAAVGHNGSRTGALRFEAWQGADLVHQGDWLPLVSPVARTADMAWWDVGLWSGKPDDAFYARYPSQVFAYLPRTIGADRVEVYVDDPTNAAPIELGFLSAMQVWQPSVGPEWPIEVNPRTVAEVEVTEGDVELGIEGLPVRDVTLRFSSLPEADGQRLNRLQREQGALGELWLDLDPLGLGSMTVYDRAMLCRQVDPPGVSFGEFWRAGGARLFREVF